MQTKQVTPPLMSHMAPSATCGPESPHKSRGYGQRQAMPSLTARADGEGSSSKHSTGRPASMVQLCWLPKLGCPSPLLNLGRLIVSFH